MTAAERAREISGPCDWEVPETRCTDDEPEGGLCTPCGVYRRALRALLAHEAEVREECAKIAENHECLAGTDFGPTISKSPLRMRAEIAQAIRDSGREKEREG